MKVTVSIADGVFAEAEALAKHLKSSRIEIYSRAVGEFIVRHAPNRATDLTGDFVRTGLRRTSLVLQPGGGL